MIPLNAHNTPDDEINAPARATSTGSASAQTQAGAPVEAEVINGILDRLGAQTGHPLRHYAPTAHTAPFGMDFWQALDDLLAAVEQRHAGAVHPQFQVEALAQIHEAVIVIDNDQCVTWLNAVAAAQYDVDPAATLGQPLPHLYQYRWLQPEDEAAAYAALAESGHWRGENIHVKRNGEQICVESIVTALTDAAGRATGMLAIIRDITDRKQAEQQLAFYASLLDHVYDAVIATDAELNITAWNRGAEAMYGWQAAEVLGRNIREAIRSTMSEETRDTALRQLAANGYYRVEVLTVHRDGTPIWVEGCNAAIHDGGGQITGYITINRDIRERKAAEAALRASEESARWRLAELEAIYNTAPVGLCVLDTELRWVRINERLAEINGFPAAAHLGRTVRELLPALADEVESIFHHVLATGEPVLNLEVSSETPAQPGVKRTWAESWFPLRNRDGNVIGINIVAEEVTERKRAEAALCESEELQRLALEGAQLGTWVSDLISGETIWDRRCREIFGVAPTEPASTQKGLSLIHPEDRPLAADAFARVLRSGPAGTYQVEKRLVWPDGTIHWIVTQGKVQVAEEAGEQQAMRLVGVVQDITERKRAEEALRVSEARYRALAAHLPNGAAFILDHHLRYLIAEGQALQAAGFFSTDLEGKTIWEVLDSHLAAQYEPLYRQALAGQPFQWEHSSHGRDYISHGTPLYNEQGEVDAVLAVSYDITERKQVEAALSESEARFRNMADTAPAMLWVTDPTGYCTFLSRGWYEFTGQTEETGLGAGWTQAAHPDDREYVHNTFLAANAASEPSSIDYRLRHRDGNYRWVIDAGRPRFSDDGGFLGYIGSVIDITERKRAEEKLRRSEERYRYLFEAMDEGFCVIEMLLDAHGQPVNYRFLETNPAFERFTGLQEALGKTALELIPDLEAHWIEIYGKIALTGEPRRFEEGSTAIGRWFDVYAFRVGGETSRRVAILFKDITEQKQTAERLHTLNATLEQRVRERTAQLEHSNRELDQFAYVASHDLKAPLRGIDHLANWITEDAAAVLPAPSKEHLNKLRGRVQRMERLLDDLLAYSRVGRYGEMPEVVETTALVKDVVALLDPPADFTVHISDELPDLVTPRTPLEIIFRNLIDNAIKHHHQPQQGEVHISAQNRGNFVQFYVRDNGPGIDPEFHERIFGVFQTLRPRDEVEGSGIGLAIVKKTVEVRGGAVTVQSTEGNGAQFCFTWPSIYSPAGNDQKKK